MVELKARGIGSIRLDQNDLPILGQSDSRKIPAHRNCSEWI